MFRAHAHRAQDHDALAGSRALLPRESSLDRSDDRPCVLGLPLQPCAERILEHISGEAAIKHREGLQDGDVAPVRRKRSRTATLARFRTCHGNLVPHVPRPTCSATWAGGSRLRTESLAISAHRMEGIIATRLSRSSLYLRRIYTGKFDWQGAL